METEKDLVGTDAATAGNPLSIDLEPPAQVQDGLLIHQAVLARGLDVMLLPRQVMLAGAAGKEPGDVSFVHGIPQASTLSGVTYAQDKRVRRALLAKAGLGVPEGATFSYRGINDAQAFVKRVGFPLVLKEAVGENPTEEISGINDEERLLEAVSELRMAPGKRSSAASSMTRSAYALTGLLDMEEDEDGNKLAAPSTRFLVEREVKGTYLRFLVLADEVLAVLHLQGGIKDGQPAQNGAGGIRCASLVPPRRKLWGKPRSEDVHPGFAEVARKAVRTIPGLALAFVDIVVTDPHAAPEGQHHWIVELSERPRLEVFSRAQAGLGEQLAEKILAYEAGRVGTALQPVRDRVTVAMRAESVPDVKTFVPLLVQAARQLDLHGHADVGDPIEGSFDAVVEGPPAVVATLTEAIMGGGLADMRAIVLTERHVDASGLGPFSQRSEEAEQAS